MVLEVAALIVAVITAVFSGQPLFSKLWKKIKAFFGGSGKIARFKLQRPFAEGSFSLTASRLQASPQHLIEAHLRPLLLRDAQLYRDTEAYYCPKGVQQRSQWETWGPADDAEWA